MVDGYHRVSAENLQDFSTVERKVDCHFGFLGNWERSRLDSEVSVAFPVAADYLADYWVEVFVQPHSRVGFAAVLALGKAADYLADYRTEVLVRPHSQQRVVAFGKAADYLAEHSLYLVVHLMISVGSKLRLKSVDIPDALSPISGVQIEAYPNFKKKKMQDSVHLPRKLIKGMHSKCRLT